MTRRNSRKIGAPPLDLAKVLIVAAPPGYGKSRFIDECATGYPQSRVLQCIEHEPMGDVLARLREAIAEMRRGEAWLLALEDVDLLDEGDIASLTQQMLPELQNGSLAFTTSRAPPAAFSSLFLPNELLVIRRSDLTVNVRQVEMLAEYAAVDESALFRIATLAHGWRQPMRIMAAQIANGAFSFELRRSDSDAWVEVFDWIETAVVGPLPEELRSALVAAATFGDLKEHDFGDFDGRQSRIATQLCDEYQLADEIQGTVRVLPLLQWFFHNRYANEMSDVAANVAGTAVSMRGELRNIRGLIATGRLGEAALAVREKHLLDLADYAYPGLILEHLQGKVPDYANFPWLWLAILPARRSFCSPEQLAAEGLSAIEIADGNLFLGNGLRAATAALLAEARRADRARELLDGIVVTRWSGLFADSARMFISVQEKNYDEALRLFRKARSMSARAPAWFVHLQRMMFRAQQGTALVGGQDLLVENTSSSVRSGHLPFAAGSSIVQSHNLAWLQGEKAATEAYRAALLRHLYQGGSPMLWRVAAATLGIDLDGPTDDDSIFEVFSLLILAEAADMREERRNYLERAISIAEESGLFRLKAAAYIALAACDPERAADAIAGAIEAASNEGSAELRDGVAAFAEGKLVLCPRYIEVFAKRFAIAAPKKEGEDETITIDIVRGGVTARDGSHLRVAERTLALLALLVTEGGTVRRERAIDLLWPNLEPLAASNALKACLHRTRRQLGDARAVELSESELRLGGMCCSNYRDILDLAEHGDPIGDVERMTAVLDAIAGESWSWAPWEWFEERVRRLREAARSMGAALLTAEMDGNDAPAAMATARAMVELEPFDELPRAAIVRAHLAMGNRPLAIEEMRRYEQLLKDELGVELPGELTALLSLAG